VAKLTDKVAKLSKNSSDYSKPPSSDIVKPPRNTKPKSLAKLVLSRDIPRTKEGLLQ